MKKYYNKIIKTGCLLLLSASLSLTSCVGTYLDEVLGYDDFYTNLDDADAAILGLYGQFMELASQVVILNELRADLMDVTPNASTYLQEINLSQPSENNPWTDVTGFYRVIQTSNDILYNFDKMLYEKRMTEAEYAERYSDVAALRTWIYLQLGIHFDKISYITTPIISPEDLSPYKGKELKLDELLDALILCMENLPTLENYQDSKLVKSTLDGYSLAPYFINKRCLLGDLYLFADRYLEAATMYRQVMATGENNSSTGHYYYYRVYVYDTGFTGPNFQVLYTRGKADDLNSLENYWRTMFAATTTSAYSLSEMIWFCSFDKKYETQYPFKKLFNPIGVDGGEYQLKPSDYAVNALWGSETQRNGAPFDVRGLTGAYDVSAGDYYIQKYSLYDNATSETQGSWFLYRAALLHLRYAEAANRAGYPFLAWVLVNNGLPNNYHYVREDGTRYPSDSIRYTGYSPTQPYPSPFYFDARDSSSPRPVIRTQWRANGGIRARANLPNTPFPETCITQQDSIRWMEKQIAHEAALELGFEGHRWGDLIRIGRRLNKETQGEGNRFFWDDNLAKKYQQSGNNATHLSTEDNWFLPLR